MKLLKRIIILHGNTNIRNWPLLLMLAASLTSMVSACDVLAHLEPESWYEREVSSGEGTFAIDPATILESLAQGKMDIFTSLSGTPEAPPLMPVEAVEWSQADYFQIAEALHEFVWKESWQDWKVNRLVFRLDCEHANKGPQQLSIVLYKIVQLREEESRFVRDIFIMPMKRSVEWSEAELQPVQENWESIDLEQIKVPAEAALQIAEANGGSEARSAIGNACDIYIRLFEPVADGWRVEYAADKDSDNVFMIFVDPLTGEFKIISPKTK
jgi:hypothetical protein